MNSNSGVIDLTSENSNEPRSNINLSSNASNISNVNENTTSLNNSIAVNSNGSAVHVTVPTGGSTYDKIMSSINDRLKASNNHIPSRALPASISGMPSTANVSNYPMQRVDMSQRTSALQAFANRTAANPNSSSNPPIRGFFNAIPTLKASNAVTSVPQYKNNLLLRNVPASSVNNFRVNATAAAAYIRKICLLYLSDYHTVFFIKKIDVSLLFNCHCR